MRHDHAVIALLHSMQRRLPIPELCLFCRPNGQQQHTQDRVNQLMPLYAVWLSQDTEGS